LCAQCLQRTSRVVQCVVNPHGMRRWPRDTTQMQTQSKIQRDAPGPCGLLRPDMYELRGWVQPVRERCAGEDIAQLAAVVSGQTFHVGSG